MAKRKRVTIAILATCLALLIGVSFTARGWLDMWGDYLQGLLDKKVSILNPYGNYSVFYKGQLHVHSDESDGALSPHETFVQYRANGYDFVALTDHDTQIACSDIFADPGVRGVLHIPSEEGGKGERTHFLEIGLSQVSPCRPSGEFDLERRINWVERQAGLAIAPHPLQEGHTWTDYELFEIPWLRGIEIHKPEYLDLWDRLLSGDRVRWGYATDDTHVVSDLNRGWVVVNSYLNPPDMWYIKEELRNGNFYSVLPGSDYDSQEFTPHFSTLEVDGRNIKITFIGSRKVRFIGRDGVLQEHDYGFDNMNFETLTYAAYGNEGYVRIELENSHGTVAYSQPFFVYGASVEDCDPFDYTRADVAYVSGKYRIVVDDWDLGLRFSSNDQATQALWIIKHYKMDKQCFITLPYATMIHYTADNKAPTGAFPGEDCVPFNRNNLKVKLIPNPQDSSEVSWKIVDGENWILDFKDSEIQAYRALEVIKKYGFSHQCFVGRPFTNADGMQYFRK